MKKISVIIAAYNAEEYLSETMDSIFLQTKVNSENEEIEIEQVLIKENVENKVKKKTTVQEVKSKTDNKKYRQQKKLSGKAELEIIL